MTALTSLAALIGGQITGDQIQTDAGLVYCSPFGKVRFQPQGGTVVDLGVWSSAPRLLAEAYRSAVAG